MPSWDRWRAAACAGPHSQGLHTTAKAEELPLYSAHAGAWVVAIRTRARIGPGRPGLYAATGQSGRGTDAKFTRILREDEAPLHGAWAGGHIRRPIRTDRDGAATWLYINRQRGCAATSRAALEVRR